MAGFLDPYYVSFVRPKNGWTFPFLFDLGCRPIYILFLFCYFSLQFHFKFLIQLAYFHHYLICLFFCLHQVTCYLLTYFVYEIDRK